MKDLPYSDAVKCYLASQMELELSMESLVGQLDQAGKLEDTVIVLSGDHYPYGLTDQEYSELLGHPVDPVFEIYENTLILWSADMDEPVYVDKYCSSLDVMPTLSNLFGLYYDSRLIMGQDILSDSPGLVIFSNYSFLHEQGYYAAAIARTLAQKAGVEMPIAQAAYEVLYEGRDIHGVVSNLMGRAKRHEQDESWI